jgi:hypothetical protein
MFMVTEADAAAIRDIFAQDGELSAAIELRRRFPGIVDNAKGRDCVRAIAGWTPLPALPAKVVRRRPRGKCEAQGCFPGFARGREVHARTHPAAESKDTAD